MSRPKASRVVEAIPLDFPVVPHKANDKMATCGHCNLSWDDTIPTSWTPTPSGRCPFEYFHKYPEQDIVMATKKWVDAHKHTRRKTPMARALAVFMFTTNTVCWLAEHDPQALKQAQLALTGESWEAYQ